MQLSRLLRSSPLRQAGLLIAVVAVVTLATLGGAFLKMRGDLQAGLRADLARELAGFDVSATPGALATLVDARARATDPARTIFAFVGDDGRFAGNARVRISDTEVTLSEISPRLPLSQAGYVHETRRLSGGVLIVAQSLQPVRQLAETFLGLLVFSLVPTVLISLGLAALIAGRAARRVEALEATLNRIAGGDLAARVEVARGDDDLVRIGRGLNRMAEKQQAATEALRQVSSDIAHDLRTPLQRIAVLLEDLQETLPEDSRAAGLASRASDQAARAVAVFGSLLQIAQIEGGRPAQRFKPFDLVQIARDMTDLYQPMAEDRGDRFNLHLPATPVMVTGDANLVGQALSNLIENALRHAPAGGTLTVSVRPDGRGGVLAVSDTGPGIPAAERDKVLRRLYRLEQSRTTPGHGLGLSLVAAVAALHGAELTLSDNAPGLLVSLRFPG